MRLAITAAVAALVASPLVAQQGFVLDADGNYVPSYNRGVSGTPGPDAPGDLLRTYAASNGSTSSGYAPRCDAPGQWFNLSGGNAEIFRTDINGVVDLTLPVTDINDSWPGLDASRDTIICVNAFDDTMSGYDRATGAPLFRFPTPTAGPVGAAYDSKNDCYWYADWTTNELVALDAASAQGGTAVEKKRIDTAAGGITRIAGVAYNCKDCTVTSGGRDQGMQVAFDADTDAVVATWAVLGGSINDPQGCGLSPESGIATTDFQDLNTRVHEGTAGICPGLFANGSNVFIVNYNPLGETRALVGHSASAGRDVIKGVLTCLSRQGIVNGGRVNLTGNPPSGTTNIGATNRAIQAGVLPSKTLTNVQFN